TQLEDAGLAISAKSMADLLVEMVELPGHPWFIACQAHPEVLSTPRDGHPLFLGFIAAARAHKAAANPTVGAPSGANAPGKSFAAEAAPTVASAAAGGNN